MIPKAPLSPYLIDGHDSKWEVLLVNPGPRPTDDTDDLLRVLFAGRWREMGEGTDSDGDWDVAQPMNEWKYWYQALRPDCAEWFDVCATIDDPLIFAIRGSSPALVTEVALYFFGYCGGELIWDELSARALLASHSN